MQESVLPQYPEPTRIERALDLLFPPVCVGCGRVGRWICPRCWTRVSWVGERESPGTTPSVEQLVGVAMFTGTAREAVHALKFENHHAIAPMMARLMAARLGAGEAGLVVPVPLHPSRKRERGYDQAALLARHLGRALGRPSRTDLLRRVRKTRQQTTLGGEERRENVRGAFSATGRLSGERILLVDDVYTTGSTMEEAARVLLDAGAASVTAVVFARAD